mmetsp:Transcript_6620/g.8078  ORF Transcript_6620/g.8078 Transcript_6620/m.8078 type:complete len:131 (+) Transcript_6620:853-1245(+)
MLQISREYLNFLNMNKASKEPVDVQPNALNMLYAAEEENDLAFLKALENLESDYPLDFKFYPLLNQPPMGWTEGIGFVTETHIKAHLPYPPCDDQLFVICGPQIFESIMCKHLQSLGYSQEWYYAYSKDV